MRFRVFFTTWAILIQSPQLLDLAESCLFCVGSVVCLVCVLGMTAILSLVSNGRCLRHPELSQHGLVYAVQDDFEEEDSDEGERRPTKMTKRSQRRR